MNKIIIGSIFAALLMLSMPVISNIQAQQSTTIKEKNNAQCGICTKSSSTIRPFCIYLGICYTISEAMLNFHKGNPVRATYWRLQKAEIAAWMIAWKCPNSPITN